MVRAHRRLRSYLLNALLIIFNMMGSAGSLLDRVGEEVLYPPPLPTSPVSLEPISKHNTLFFRL